jgi:hypothetical protein
MNYNQDWEECIGAGLRKEIEANNAEIQRIKNYQLIDLQRAEADGEPTLDEKIKIAPFVFGVVL